MAMRTTVITECDIHGPDCTGNPTELQFMIDGKHHEIDLCEYESEQLRGILGQYTPSARKTARTRSTVLERIRNQPPSRGVRHTPAYLRAAREWCRLNGMNVSDRGRVPAGYLKAYDSQTPAQ